MKYTDDGKYMFEPNAFPHSKLEHFEITSPENENYNCITWAFDKNDKTRFYWPTLPEGYWPEGITKECTLDAFIELFNSIGYEMCDNGDLEEGFQKVSIWGFANDDIEHAARQLPNGLWTSKLGVKEDFSHTIKSMDRGHYGEVLAYMKRQIKVETD